MLEILVMDADMDELIARRSTAKELRTAAMAKGFRPLAEAGIHRVLEGVTTLAELARAVDHPGLVEARLIRLEDGTFVDAWRWDSAEQMQAALESAPFPEAGSAWSLTREATSEDGEIVDER